MINKIVFITIRTKLECGLVGESYLADFKNMILKNKMIITNCYLILNKLNKRFI
jgi:hypothetical protein